MALARLLDGEADVDRTTPSSSKEALEESVELRDQRLEAPARRRRGCAAPRPRARPRLRRGQAARAPAQHKQFTKIVGVEVVPRRARVRRAAPAPRPRCPTRARARRAPARLARLPRPPPRRASTPPSLIEVDRAHRPAAPARVRAGAVRRRAARDGRADHPERRVQRELRETCRPARCAITTTASSGPGPSSPRGPRASPRRNSYAVELAPVGPVDPELGAPTQMGVFRR